MSGLDLSSFTIVPANQDQIIQHARAAHHHWGHGRSFEDFIEGTNRERTESWGKDGYFNTWVLVKRVERDGEIYSGCEVYRRKTLIKQPGKEEVEDGAMYGIASVVTPIKHLKHGYATHLLRLLHYQLGDPSTLPPFPETWGAPPPLLLPQDGATAIGSILWSDVGYKFYEKCTVGTHRPGWVVKPEQNTQLIWKCLDPDEYPTSSVQDEYEWTWIKQEDMPSIAEFLSNSIREKLKRISTDHTLFQADPASPGLLTWLSIRGPWLSKIKPGPDEPFGIKMINSSGDDTIVLFTAYNDHIGPRLLITYTHNLLPEHLESLLWKLDIVAKRGQRKEGWIWGLDLDSDLVKAWSDLPRREVRKGQRDEINGHLLGVAWYGSERDKGEFVDWQIWDWC